MTMAAPVPTSTRPARDEPQGASYRLFGLVRDIRAEAQNIVRALAPVRAALALKDPAAQASELAAALTEARRVVNQNRPQVEERFTSLRDLLETSSRTYDLAGDAVTEIENRWREIEHALAWTGTPTASEMTGRLATVGADVKAIEWQAAIVTVPSRVRQHLATKRVGGQLRFHEAFRDEVEDEGQRVELLRYLREHAASFGGVVDVPSGLIYKIGSSPARRAFSWVLVVGLATVGAYLFVYVLTHGIPAIGLTLTNINGINEARFPELIGAYWALLIGMVVHLVVEAIKQQQRGGDSSFLALEDWFVWVHVREMSLSVGVLSMYFILVGLALVMTDAGSITFITAFGAGYGSDSVLGLFITRFDASVKTTTDTLARTIGGASP